MAASVRRNIKISGAFLFGVYLMGLVYCLFLADDYGRGMTAAFYDYNIQPFREIRRYLTYREVLGTRTVVLNLAGNIIGFIPFGALLPLVARSIRKAWKVTVLGIEVSTLVEVTQILFQVGCFDVDDIILNTLGVMLGYIIYSISSGCYCGVERRHLKMFLNQNLNKERL